MLAPASSSDPPPLWPPWATLIVAALLFALMATAAKAVASAIPGPQIAFVRFGVGLVACAAVAARRPLRANDRRGLLLRGLYGASAVLLYFLAIEHLPVGVATLLNYTAPVFTTLYAALLLGEGITRTTLVALSLTSLGVGCVIVASAPAGALTLGPWQLAGIASAILSGAAVATIRQVRRTDGPWEIFLSFCAVGALFTAPQTWLGWVQPDAQQWGLLLLVGALSVAAQVLMTYALRWVRAALAGVIAQLTPVFCLALGWLLFDERLGPLGLFGAGITLVGVCLGASLAAAPLAVRRADL